MDICSQAFYQQLYQHWQAQRFSIYDHSQTSGQFDRTMASGDGYRAYYAPHPVLCDQCLHERLDNHQ